MTDFRRQVRLFNATVFITLFAFLFVSCSSFYHFRPLSHPDPQALPVTRTIGDTGITLGIRSYHLAQDTHSLFGSHGLWREHVLPILLVVSSSHPGQTVHVEPNSIFLDYIGKSYRNISPAEAFDIAWQANVPYQNIKKTLYYTGLILFTIVTLGLGSMIWVLPTPFSQPTPSSSPFGRDLAYKAFPPKADILPNGKIGGLLYFNLPFNEALVKKAALSLQISVTYDDPKRPHQTYLVNLPLSSTGKSEVNPMVEMLKGFF
jgi:hypothetical protein|uniref:Lipoprotein n=1 Tax=Leptospirillum ferrodiazotrophum TaxID=412449 RepID=C6HWZ1_9BACT|nr:MAG: protein of unknown function [Leptospirillum ferrodiazotrophum]